MKKEGCKVTKVDELMQRDQQRDALLNRRPQQDHKAAYFEELRNGALWVNEIIAELGLTLGHQASELFFLCKLKVPAVIVILQTYKVSQMGDLSYGINECGETKH